MKIGTLLLDQVGHWYVGTAYATIKSIVHDLESDSTLTGAQKKQEVISTLKTLGFSLVGALVDLGISLARTALIAAI
jgi:hypothetical protein